MIPKIEFVYSWTYDNGRRENQMLQKKLEEKGEKYPSADEIEKYIVKIEKVWKKHSNPILKEIEKVSGLKWKDQKIKCYIMGYGRALSDPLTVPISKDKNEFVDTLTHELIHQIQIQNRLKTRKWWKFINDNYKEEVRDTKNHISVHSIHNGVLINLFGIKRLEKNIENTFSPGYKRSWEIVQKEGYDYFTKKFKELTK